LPRLRWFTYDAHKRLSELDKAIADATLLIEGRPDDKDFWWWRGIVYEEKGDLEKAAADYRQTLALEPRVTGIPFNLAAIYEKQGKPCEAILPIEQFLRYHPDVADRERVNERLLRLYSTPDCQTLAGKGRAVISFRPGEPVIHTSVKLGSERGDFIVDTGASYTALTSELARKLGLTLSSKILIHTANGAASARLSVVDDIQVQGARARDVPVVVFDELPPNVDGLLGLSFLARFQIVMESTAGKLTISAKR
jgi:aspartyl protease family protein